MRVRSGLRVRQQDRTTSFGPRGALGLWWVGVSSPSEVVDFPMRHEQMVEVVVEARKRLDVLEDEA